MGSKWDSENDEHTEIVRGGRGGGLLINSWTGTSKYKQANNDKCKSTYSVGGV